MGVELKDGSAEYWEYKEMAEDIYRDFCFSTYNRVFILQSF